MIGARRVDLSSCGSPAEQRSFVPTGLGRSPNAGSPRWLPRRPPSGARCGGAGMTDSSAGGSWLAAELARPVELPSLLPGGEPLSTFMRRAIFDNPDFAKPADSCRRLSIDVSVPAIFSPASITQELFEQVHAALANLRVDPAVDRFARSFSALWRDARGLDLHMALQPRVILDPRDEQPAPLPPGVQQRLDIARLSARRRDWLAVQLFDRIRDGAYTMTAFIASDLSRAEQLVPIGWWNDKAVVCRWRNDELLPEEGAPPGTPHFRGLRLRDRRGVAEPSNNLSSATSFTSADVERWFRFRLAEFAAAPRHPTEKQDLEAARLPFPGVSRDAIRSLRAQYVLKDRRKQGPNSA